MNYKNISGYENVYQVTDMGEIFSCRKGRFLKKSVDKDGYYVVSLCYQGTQVGKKVHRLVCEAFYGPSTLLACHVNGDKTDNRLENLYWGTPKDNMMDKKGHGTNFQSNKTHCIYGHLLDYPNLKVSALEKYGWRHCLACGRSRSIFQKMEQKQGRKLTALEKDSIRQECYSNIIRSSI